MYTTNDILTMFKHLYKNNMNIRTPIGNRPQDSYRTIELQNVQFICDKNYIIPDEDFNSKEFDDEWYLTYYEPRITSKHILRPSDYKFISQIDYVVDAIYRNPSTRQAVLSMIDSSEYARPNDTMMCTTFMQCFLNGDHLSYSVHLRSNDLRRFSQDLQWNIKIQHIIAERLSKLFACKIECDPIIWNVGSLHIYENYWKYLE